MRRRSSYSRLVIIAGLFVFICAGSCLALNALWGGLRASSAIPIEGLLLNETAFPDGWQTDSQGPHQPEGQAPLGGGLGPVEAVKVYFYVPVNGGSGGAHEEILRFRTTQEASRAYDRKNTPLIDDIGLRNWAPPDGVDFNSSIALSEHLACTDNVGISRCKFIAQYDEYVVELDVGLVGYTSELESVQVMTFAELESVLWSIDKAMNQVTDPRS